jgi:hypothetical protein
MITRVFLAARRRDMTTEACLEHWRGHHAAIGARLPRVRAYVQNHGVLDGGRFLLPYPGFDIMPELDWDDLAAMDAAIDSPVHERDSVDDEANFIDTSRTGLAVTTRHVLAAGAAGADAMKLITFVRRAPTASDKAFHDALLGDYAGAIAETRPIRHELLVTIPDRPNRPPFTAQAIDLLWFASARDALAWATSESAAVAAWALAGLAFGAERLIARPYKVL